LPEPRFAEDSRVLFISPPGDAELRSLAEKLRNGLIVVLGTPELVHQGRKLHSDLENVMFVPATAEDIPWQDAFFDQVLDPKAQWQSSLRAAAEILRVSRKRE
jgi:hypothetical protein